MMTHVAPPKDFVAGDDRDPVDEAASYSQTEKRVKTPGASQRVRSYLGDVFSGVGSSGRAPVVSGPVTLVIAAADVDPRGEVNHPRDR